MLLNPLAVNPAWGDPLLHRQVGWWLGRERMGKTLNNILNPRQFKGTLQTGAKWAYRKTGPAVAFDGVNGFVDLGTTRLLSNTDPFTLAWLEQPGNSPSTYEGIFTFMPSGTTQRFYVLRTDTDVNYKTITIGQGLASTNTRWTTAPSMAACKGNFKLWVLRGPSGMGSASPATFDLRVDGNYLGAGVSSSALSTATAVLNYIGWDGADSKFSGSITNVRLWNRSLTYPELVRLNLDPFAGLDNGDVWVPPTSVVPPATGRHDTFFLVM